MRTKNEATFHFFGKNAQRLVSANLAMSEEMKIFFLWSRLSLGAYHSLVDDPNHTSMRSFHKSRYANNMVYTTMNKMT